MFETSKDVFNLISGFSILLVAVLFSWVLFQVGRALKGMNDTIKIVRNIAQNIDEGVNTFKSKAGNAAAIVSVLVKTGQGFLKKFQDKKTTRRKKSEPSQK
ncbi:hypothetical protein HON36_01965 [Candidatus Parcubacteria bacterium]|jgi:hypothetical protein|nr:hypothetical protein [Candidatus Parcubacteria bacterium]MBT7228442.1 hypothetical protein [Candidatus Parcubacteria bacterium]